MECEKIVCYTSEDGERVVCINLRDRIAMSQHLLKQECPEIVDLVGFLLTEGRFGLAWYEMDMHDCHRPLRAFVVEMQHDTYISLPRQEACVDLFMGWASWGERCSAEMRQNFYELLELLKYTYEHGQGIYVNVHKEGKYREV